MTVCQCSEYNFKEDKAGTFNSQVYYNSRCGFHDKRQRKTEPLRIYSIKSARNDVGSPPMYKRRYLTLPLSNAIS